MDQVQSSKTKAAERTNSDGTVYIKVSADDSNVPLSQQKTSSVLLVHPTWCSPAKRHVLFSIFNSLFCCLCSLPALYYAAQAITAARYRDERSYGLLLQKASRMNWAAFGVGLILAIPYIIYFYAWPAYVKYSSENLLAANFSNVTLPIT